MVAGVEQQLGLPPRSTEEAPTVVERPYVLLSCGMSIDGYVDNAAEERLLLSNDADFDRVDEVRAGHDAILVGAGTVRQDNPRLLVRSAARREQRVARGLPPTPLKVTVTAGCDLDPAAQFFTAGDVEKLVYCAGPALDKAHDLLDPVATVVDAGDPADVHRIVTDLYRRGVRRLMVEGGQSMHTQFLTAGLVDELHLVVAPFFVGDSQAPRFVGDGRFPWRADRRAVLAETRQIGDVVLLRYALSDRFGAA
jgi:5-amino-6-(5-phosphoribosylamino)uracil reductase